MSWPTRMLRAHPEWVAAFALFVVYAVYVLSRFPQFNVAGYDLGIFDQAVRRYAHFQAPMVPLKGDDFNLLGDHFHPIIATLAPLYWLWDDPRMLVLAQAAITCASVPIVWRFLARRITSSRLVGALAVLYGLSWPLQRMVDFDFHEICFAIPLLALAVDAIDTGRDRRLLLASLALLLVREDMGAIVAMLGVVRALRPPRGSHGLCRWLLPTALVITGTCAFVWVTQVFLPSMNPTGHFAYWNYTRLGDSPGAAIGFMVTHPLRTLAIFFTPWTKTVTLAYLLVPLVLLPLASPYTLVALPLLAQRFFSDRSYVWTTEYHYSAPIEVVVFLAAVDTLARLGRRWQRPLVWTLIATHLLLPLLDAAFQATKVMPSWNYPLVRLLGPAWERSPHLADQKALLTHIPPNTCVEADDRLAAQLTRTNRVTLPTLTRLPSDFIALDMSQREVGFPLPSPQHVRHDAGGRGYRVVAQYGDLVLLQRPGPVAPSDRCRAGQP